jgi:hypothetical protein
VFSRLQQKYFTAIQFNGIAAVSAILADECRFVDRHAKLAEMQQIETQKNWAVRTGVAESRQ